MMSLQKESLASSKLWVWQSNNVVIQVDVIRFYLPISNKVRINGQVGEYI